MDVDAGWESIGEFKGDSFAFAGSELGEEVLFGEELWRGLGPPVDEGEEEVGIAAGIADGPVGIGGLEGAESGDIALVGLGKGLGGGDTNASAIVAAGSGADDDGREGFADGEFRKETAERREEITFLGSFADEGFLGKDDTIASEEEGGIGHTGF